MNFSCIFLLALALFGAVSQAYIGGGYNGLGYNGLYETGCGAPYGAGYGAGYEGGYGCRASAAVCDACQCVKTIVRPNVVERIPYNCARRVQAPSCRSTALYAGAGYGVGAIGSGCNGYANGGYANGGYANGGYVY